MTWGQWFESWWGNLPPRLLETQKIARRAKSVPHIQVGNAKPEQFQDVIELWSRWYSVSSKTRCYVPLEVFAEAVATRRWEVLVATHEDGRIVGTVVKRWLPKVCVKGVEWSRVGVVDFFCVVPAWRNKGVGRLLLSEAHNRMALPLTPMLILWEGVQFRQPPLTTGLLWVRQSRPGGARTARVVEKEAEELWRRCSAGREIVSKSAEGAMETSVWRVGQEAVVVWDSHHRSVPEGYKIGYVIGWTDRAAVDAFVEAQGNPWQICLCSTKVSELWSWDSSFQWIGYNLQTGFVSQDFPCLAL